MAVVVTPARLRRDLQRLVADTQSATLAISSTPVVSARLAPGRDANCFLPAPAHV
jgi:hypothetical protein